MIQATLRSVRDGVSDYVAWAQDPTPRIPLGLPFFDKPTSGGIAKAECCMVLAYSGVGKTSLALNMIAANPSVPTVFFSIEMSWRLVMARLAAIDSGVPTWELEADMRDGVIPQALIDAGIKYPNLLGCDRSEISVKEMGSLVLDAGRSLGKPVRLVIIDYLELIGGAGMLGKSEQVDKAATKVRALGKDCDTSVVVLHQVGKGDGGGGSKPLGADSGRYGGNAPMDYVIGASAPRLNPELTERQVEECQEELYLQLLKNRSGKSRPAGVKHRQSQNTGRVSPWSDHIYSTTSPGYQATLTTPARPAPDLEFA